MAWFENWYGGLSHFSVMVRLPSSALALSVHACMLLMKKLYMLLSVSPPSYWLYFVRYWSTQARHRRFTRWGEYAWNLLVSMSLHACCIIIRCPMYTHRVMFRICVLFTDKLMSFWRNCMLLGLWWCEVRCLKLTFSLQWLEHHRLIFRWSLTCRSSRIT